MCSIVKPKFTAGPWYVDPKSPEESFFEDVNILRHSGLAVAVALQNGDITPDKAEVNAHLIAAAPTLYETLEIALSAMESGDMRLIAIAKQAVRLSLAKARGES